MHATLAEQLGIAEVARRARRAARLLGKLPESTRNNVLLAAADEIEKRREKILAANERDCGAAQREVEAGRMSRAMFDRLRTSERGVKAMAAQVREVRNLPDPLGQMLATTKLDDDLILRKVSCPLGVVGIIFESRPDVIPQVVSLTIKSGNAALLKGGTEAAHTNEALVAVWRDALSNFPEIPVACVNLLHTRDEVKAILSLDRDIDLIIPRGSKEFVRYIADNSRIPVLGHGEGICHVYVNRAADLEKALEITLDSKIQYPAACNAAETLLVDDEIAARFIPQAVARLRSTGVEVRGCARTRELVGKDEVVPAREDDWAREYSDLIISVKVVKDLDEAVEHIDTYGSRHTETIVTEDAEAANQFMEMIDAAGVFHNASTRFADGFRYGL
ncbi:MAG TPA: glutamate-5-semialdehyde dehydrogenase, partial [Pyrinomonadaceae bacterium]|nr:glutamate-5-semialdehyde dehydrogenase [Pyrinomonadaceae bacterium]